MSRLSSAMRDKLLGGKVKRRSSHLLTLQPGTCRDKPPSSNAHPLNGELSPPRNTNRHKPYQHLALSLLARGPRATLRRDNQVPWLQLNYPFTPWGTAILGSCSSLFVPGGELTRGVSSPVDTALHAVRGFEPRK